LISTAVSAAEHAVWLGRGKQNALSSAPMQGMHAGSAVSMSRAISALRSAPVQTGAQPGGRQQSSSPQAAPAHSPGPAAAVDGIRPAAAQSIAGSSQLAPVGFAHEGSSSAEPPPQAQQAAAAQISSARLQESESVFAQ
jgi:hypothetical protein